MPNFGEAFSKGITGYIEGQEAQQTRQQRQQQLTQQAQQFQMETQRHDTQMQVMQQQLTMLQGQNQKVADNTSKDNLYRAFDRDTLTDLNYALKSDPNMKNLFPGIDNVTEIDSNNPIHVRASKDMKTPVLINSVEKGTIVQRVADLETLKVRTGYSSYSAKRDLELGVTEQAVEKTDIMSEAMKEAEADPENTRTIMMEALMLTMPEKFLGKGGSQRRDSLQQYTEAFFRANPNATPQEFSTAMGEFVQKSVEGVGAVREERDIAILNVEEKAAEKLFEAPEFDKTKARDLENTIFAKLDEKKKKAAQDDVNTMKINYDLSSNLDRLLKEKAPKIDKDIIADTKTWIASKFGGDSEQAFANVDFNTRAGILLTSFVKAISGTAVSDQEFQRLQTILMSGNLNDEDYVKQAIESFSSELMAQNTQIGSTIKSKAPYSVDLYTPKEEKKEIDKTDDELFGDL